MKNSNMDNKSLSQLTKDYSAGKISKDDYRKMRSELLQEIITGSIILKENKYTPPHNLKKKSKKKIKLTNLQNKRPIFIAISVLCSIVIILFISVLALR
tara:strand:+ start:51 stop:347 length:297 start_codon:yes stop_codon:yes gene_type:complete